MSTNEKEVPASNLVALIVAWVWVGIPLAWGISQTFIKASALFN